MRRGKRSPYMKELWISTFGDKSVEQCIELYQKCGCSGDCVDRRDCTRGVCGDLFISFNTQMMFFCNWGSDECRKKGRASLEQAKHNLKTHYTAVALLERQRDSLALMAQLLPEWFDGLEVMFALEKRVNDENKDRSMLPATRAFLEKANDLDIDFYEHAKKVFEERFKEYFQ